VTEPDAFSRHEALHMSLFLAQTVERELLDHPAVASDPALRALAEAACDALQTLYQKIGAAAGPGR